MQRRFRADRSSLDDFADEVLVVCGQCGGQAVVRLHALDDIRSDGPLRANLEGRFACVHCGRSERKTAFLRHIHGPADSVFGYPVWLNTPCCGQILWAYNARHLDALEAFVRATLRERRPDPESGWRNKAWVSRIPRWLTAATNREEVLRCISLLRRERLETGRERS